MHDANASHWCAVRGDCQPVRWLHIPKTGTTIGTAIYRYACDGIPPNATIPSVSTCEQLPASHRWKSTAFEGVDAPCNPPYPLEHVLPLDYPPETHCPHLALPFVGHAPVQPRDHGMHSLVAMFRHPIARARSLLNMMRKEFAASRDEPWRFLSLFGGRKCHRLHSNAPTNATLEDLYRVGASCVSGCMTKMILGHDCHAPLHLNRSHAAAACKLLSGQGDRAFRFVGLTEQWDDSLRLFHCVLGGDAVASEALNTRPAARAHPPPSMARSDRQAQADAMAWRFEPIDGAVYRCAQRRFAADRARCVSV